MVVTQDVDFNITIPGGVVFSTFRRKMGLERCNLLMEVGRRQSQASYNYPVVAFVNEGDFEFIRALTESVFDGEGNYNP